jgi:nucleoside-diphosphate-sugar epimerase
MVYINDAIRLISLILDSESPSYPVYNTGGHTISVWDLAALIEELTGTSVTWNENAEPWGRPPIVSHSRAAEDFGYDLTPLSDSILDYISRL